MTGMPYGGVINWTLPGGKSVHDFAVHHGYRHIVAWGVHMGSFAYYIEMQCAKAREMNAPLDAIYLSGPDWEPEGRVWREFSHIPHTRKGPDGTTMVDRLEGYVSAMLRLEDEKKGARA